MKTDSCCKVLKISDQIHNTKKSCAVQIRVFDPNPDIEKLNVNGGAMALGHPLGASGAKLMTTLLHELERTKGKYGLQAICEGGGTANATIIERM